MFFPSGPGWKMWTGVVRSIWRSPLETWPSSSQTLRRRPSLLRPPLPQQTFTATAAPARTTRSGGAPGRPRRAGRALLWTEKPTDAPLQSSCRDDPHSPAPVFVVGHTTNTIIFSYAQSHKELYRLNALWENYCIKMSELTQVTEWIGSLSFFLCHESKRQVVWLFNYCIVPNTGGRSIGIHRMSLYALCKNVKRSSLNNSLHIDCC